MTLIVNSIELMDANGIAWAECTKNYISNGRPNVKKYTEEIVFDLPKYDIPISNQELVEELKKENFKEKFVNRAISLATLITIKATKNLKIPKNAIVIGVTLQTPVDITNEIYKKYELGKELRPYLCAYSISSSICTTVSRFLNTSGSSFMVNQSCSSFLVALELAKNFIALNRTEMVIITGVDCASHPVNALIFNSLGIYDKNEVKPFCKQRAGIALGEAAVCFVVTNKQNCQNKIAKIDDLAFYNDHHSLTSPDPEGIACEQILKKLTNNYQIKVDSVNCHATGTAIGDSTELKGLEKIPYSCDIYGLKGSLGHTMASSAGVEMAYSMRGLIENWVPYTSNVKDQEYSKHNIILNKILHKTQNNFIKLSFGFGGSAAGSLVTKIDN